MKILVIFFHGNLFNPKAGNESRLHNLTKQLSKENDVITLESGEFKNENNYFVKNRFFFKPLIFKNNHLGTFFANINPSYIHKLYEIMNKEKPQIIHVSYPHGLFMARILKKIVNYNPVLIYEAHNVESQKLLKIAKKEKGLISIKNWIIYLYTSLMEKTACLWSDHIITVSELDKKALISIYSLDEDKLTVVPNSTNIINLKSYDQLDTKEKLGLDVDKIILLFHGTYAHYPNKEAIRLIKEYISPQLFKKYKNIELVIAGKDVPNFEVDNVNVLGFVPNLEELLIASDISIVPIIEGGGTRVKILDYFGAGLPTVSTKKGIEGINAKNYEDALIVEKVDSEFINSISYLIENKKERERIGKNAYNLAKNQYDWNKVGEDLNYVYVNLIKYDQKE